MRPSVTPEYAGWSSEPWPSTKSTSPPRSTPSSTSRSAAPAMKSATTASTEIPQPAIAMPVWPVGTNSLLMPRRRASRSSSSETVIFPIAQSEPTVRTIRASSSRLAPVGTIRAGGGFGRSRSWTPCLDAMSTSSGSSVRNSCSPFSTSSPFETDVRSSSRQAGGKRPPEVATPTSAVVGLKQSASLMLPTIGIPSCVSPALVESSMATTGSRPWPITPRAVFPWCGSPEWPSARTRYRLPLDTEARSVLATLDAVLEGDARPGILGEQEVAVEVDVLAERGDLRGRCDAEARLDHAAEHHVQPERARRVGHAHGLADPARLRQLDVDAVRALGAEGDVGERVAVLVDVDRDRGALLQRDPGGIARRQRLLAVLDAERAQL